MINHQYLFTFSTSFTFLRNFLPFEPLLSSWWSASAAFFSSLAFLPSSVASYSNQPATRPPQRTAAFNRMCKHDFDFLCSLFMSLYPLYPFYIFSLFVVDKGVSLCSYVFLKLRWGNQTYVVLSEQSVWVKLFLPFLQNMFLLNEKPFKALDH